MRIQYISPSMYYSIVQAPYRLYPAHLPPLCPQRSTPGLSTYPTMSLIIAVGMRPPHSRTSKNTTIRSRLALLVVSCPSFLHIRTNIALIAYLKVCRAPITSPSTLFPPISSPPTHSHSPYAAPLPLLPHPSAGYSASLVEVLAAGTPRRRT